MRILTILTGIIFVAGGLFLIAEEGISFMSVAFVVGVLFAIAGIIECLSYQSYRGERESRTWVLVDGFITIILGGLIICNQIVADAVVPSVLGFWSITIGIRNFVRIFEKKKHSGKTFRAHLVIGILNTLVGVYVFFDSELFNLPAIILVAMCIIVNGINIINIGYSIVIEKPQFIKTKQELLAEAQKKMEEAHENAKIAIQAAKDARTEFAAIYDADEASLDITQSDKPKDKEVEEIREKRRTAKMTEEELAEVIRQKELEQKALEDKIRAAEVAAEIDAKAEAEKILWAKRSEAAKRGAETKRRIAAEKAAGTYVEPTRTPEEQALWEKRSVAALKGAETKRRIAEQIANGTYVDPASLRTPEEQALWEKRSEAAKKGAETKRQQKAAEEAGN